MQTDMSSDAIGHDQIVLTDFRQRLQQCLDFNVLKIPFHLGVDWVKRLTHTSTGQAQQQETFEKTNENDREKFVR
jgi:hypothetical protein